jgi:hypothetical protein
MPLVDIETIPTISNGYASDYASTVIKHIGTITTIASYSSNIYSGLNGIKDTNKNIYIR